MSDEALEKANSSSGAVYDLLIKAGVPMTRATSKGKTRTGVSTQRMIRYVRGLQDPDCGVGGKGRKGKGSKRKVHQSPRRSAK